MHIREDNSPWRALDLSGTPDELRRIAHSLSTIGDVQSAEFVPDSAADPAPYDRCLAKFNVIGSGGPARVFVSGNILRTTGSPRMLAIFASFFSFPDDAEPGMHAHHEYLDESNMAPDSPPLIISVAKLVAE